ncbi:L,D-transpeptidase family protein [Nonomuraea sp. NBC_01738]|uniref:L,D-transpeptidase family protein n=1 Tax=Nonomuraea sp. NBC_01738 TaxID=2976003 RepID=UPI002E15BB7D|nr:L,D-transpeptidase family protein [Nonomuraea sp. NBC_01738]
MIKDARWSAALICTIASTALVTLSAPAHADPPKLRYHQRGVAITQLQQALDKRGFLWGRPNGVYDQRTRYAVWAFQKSRGMRPRTPVGPAVLRALHTPRRREAPPKSLRTGALVDLGRQLLTVYRDYRPVLTVHVSTGAGVEYCHDGRCRVAVTPVGDYRIFSRVAGVSTGPLGSMYNTLYFNGGIALHGSLAVPRHPASHGCVRMPLRAADRVFALLHEGDPVHVRARV